MTPERQRVVIAEACGLTNVAPWIVKNVKHEGDDITVGIWSDDGWVPQYLNDLNAMHDAVSIFDYDQADEFEDHLCDICKRLNDEKENPAPWRFAVVNATASQRAEAFLRTIGKWEESR
tara:strand:- start:258 stop:614 length:357 start_codon:yes stop_codon:yes gene_type:complete